MNLKLAYGSGLKLELVYGCRLNGTLYGSGLRLELLYGSALRMGLIYVCLCIWLWSFGACNAFGLRLEVAYGSGLRLELIYGSGLRLELVYSSDLRI